MRHPRLFVAGQAQHLIQRGNNRGAIFFSDVDRRFFLKLLGESLATQACALHAYVLMTNHVHLLVTEAIPRAVQSLGRRYVQTINRLHGRTGTLWEGRYRSAIVADERYLLTCYRYIEANPMRAGMVGDPAAYPWSSYAHNALGRCDKLLTEHSIYRALGASSADRRSAYRSLAETGLDEATVNEIRDSTQRGWVIGSDCLQAEIAAKAGRSVGRPRRGRPPRLPLAGFAETLSQAGWR